MRQMLQGLAHIVRLRRSGLKASLTQYFGLVCISLDLIEFEADGRRAQPIYIESIHHA